MNIVEGSHAEKEQNLIFFTCYFSIYFNPWNLPLDF